MNQQLSFLKYQSLGNDFILLDWSSRNLSYLLSDPMWRTWVKKLCHRNFGIGADGILILTEADLFECSIFNADGSSAQTCLNGARCAAHYLHTKDNNQTEFLLKMGPNKIRCSLNGPHIQTEIPYSFYQGPLSCAVKNRTFTGHLADVGNPHFIIFDKISREECAEYGPLLERAAIFSEGSNISFASEGDSNGYTILTHERGVGLTHACGSAGTALIRTLYELGKIPQNQEVLLQMTGGSLYGSVTTSNTITLHASAELVFRGITHL